MKTLADILTPLLPKAKPEYLQALREGRCAAQSDGVAGSVKRKTIKLRLATLR